MDQHKIYQIKIKPLYHGCPAPVFFIPDSFYLFHIPKYKKIVIAAQAATGSINL